MERHPDRLGMPFFLKDKTRICVACNNHTVLELLVVQPSGKKVMKAKDFANGGFRKYLKYLLFYLENFVLDIYKRNYKYFIFLSNNF